MSKKRGHVPAIVREVTRAARKAARAIPPLDAPSQPDSPKDVGEVLGWEIEKLEDGLMWVGLRLERGFALAAVFVTEQGSRNKYDVRLDSVYRLKR